MRYLFPLFAFLLFGCAEFSTSSTSLNDRFIEYKTTVNKDNVVELAKDFFSASLLGNDFKSNSEAKSQLLFKEYMSKAVSHYEEIDLTDGCLSINGYDKENLPLIFNLKYILQENKWLIDKIHLDFVESTKDFVKQAKCPA